MEPEDTSDENSTAARLRRQAIGPLSFIPGIDKATESLTPMFDKVGSVWDGFMSMLNDFVLSIFSKPQKAAKDEFVAGIESQTILFGNVATQLGLDGALAEDLQNICKRSAKSSFGWVGMPSEKDDAVKNLNDVQQALEARIRTSLVDKYGTQLSDDDRTNIAQRAAASITGIPQEHLDSADRDALIAAAPPATGYGAMLFAIRAGVESKATPITVPGFGLDHAMLGTARALIPGQTPAAPAAGAPAPANAADHARMLEQAGIWMGYFEARGVKFNDTNGDGQVNVADLATALNGKAHSDIRGHEQFIAVVRATPGLVK